MATSNRTIVAGLSVWVDGKKCVVKALIDIDSALVADAETGETRAASIHSINLSPPAIPSEQSKQTPDLLGLPENRLAIAKARLDAITPLLGRRTRAEVTQRAKDVGVSVATLYNWIKTYEDSGLLSSLVRRGRTDKGESRLPEEVEQLMVSLIDKRFLTAQKLSKRKIVREVQDACKLAGLTPPHYDTVLTRIERIPEFERKKKREGNGAAQQLLPATGEFPGADWPLAYVLIDHTPMDIEVVDDETRRPIGRPWISLALEAFSRMVMGFSISLDPPSSMSVGMCLAQAMLPKDEIVAKAGCENSWPIWGKIGALHLDNAKEFRGKALLLACDEYGIDVQWRPVHKPHYGGMVERMMGTLASELHALPGTTFSNSQEKGEYDSCKTAMMTLAELEKWLTVFLVDVYHQRVHRSLGMSPVKKLQEGLLGSSSQRGRGLIPVPNDAARIRIDFMPFEERSIQRQGVSLDGVAYYDPVLRPWVKARDVANPTQARKFIFKRDPRDISRLYFYDPDLKEYFTIPYRDRTRPPISIWELRAATKQARLEGAVHVDEEAIFRAHQHLRRIEERASEDTRKTRRQAQRRKLHRGSAAGIEGAARLPQAGTESDSAEAMTPIAPFDDVAFGDDA